MFLLFVAFLSLVIFMFALANTPLTFLLKNRLKSEDIKDLNSHSWFKATALSLLGVIILVAGFIAYPYVNVWKSRLEGQAILAKAQGEKQAKTEEALAVKESAIHFKDAEITRAEGVKEANRIIAEGLGGPEGYLRYLFINNLKEMTENPGTTVIYVPTEAGIPIQESTRIKK